MDFLNKLGKTASATYQYTACKTSKIAKEAKWKMNISENKGKIDEIYEIIGKKVYENHVREEKQDLLKMVKPECDLIDQLASEIEIARKEILKLKDKKQCPKCDYEMELVFKYCPNCGEKQQEELEAQTVLQEKQQETDHSIQEKKEDYNNIDTVLEDAPKESAPDVTITQPEIEHEYNDVLDENDLSQEQQADSDQLQG